MVDFIGLSGEHGVELLANMAPMVSAGGVPAPVPPTPKPEPAAKKRKVVPAESQLHRNSFLCLIFLKHVDE